MALYELIVTYLILLRFIYGDLSEPELGDRKDEALKEELAAYKASLSDEEVVALVEQTATTP